MDFIDRYLALGWGVIPLEPRSKKPVLPWAEFQKKPPDRSRWNLWREVFPVPPHGLAVICGAVSGLIVIDCDDPETAVRLRAKVPFETPEVVTRRGAHFYFAYRQGIPSTTVEIPDIGRVEVRSDRVLSTLPPSIHPSGRKYQWALAPWEVSKIPPLPEFILNAIYEKQRQKELARAVGTVQFPKPGRKFTRDALREILAQVGGEILREFTIGEREAWRLRACPVCGKSEGNPWVWADTGRLVDFRQTCPASRDQGGLPLRAWLKELGREGLIENLEAEEPEEAPLPEVPASSVEEARSLILTALRGGGDLIVTVPPGVGKSWTSLEWLCKEGPRPAVWSVPTLSLAQELAAKARKLTADPVVVFEGRNARTCLRWEEARIARDLGYDPGEILCPTCPHNPKSAVFSQKCEFMRQFEGINREKGLFFASHKLACHLIKDFLKKVKVWILDEEPHRLIEVVSCPLDGLRTLRAVFPEDSATGGLAEAMLKLGDELHKAANGKNLVEGRIYARPVEFGPWAGKKTLEDLLDLDFTQLAPIVRDEIAQVFKNHRKFALFRKGINLKALRWLQEVASQGLAYLVARKDPERPIELRRVVNPIPDKWRGRLVVLDATAYPPVVERALRRPGMQVLDVRVPVEVETAWVKRAVCKTAIVRARGRKIALKALKEALKTVKAEKILVFCHQAIKSDVEKAVVDDGREIVVTHHFGSETRGTNQFADFNAVILLGLPVPAPGAFYDAGLALGLSAEEWTDWLDLLARAEAWQEIHRIRLVLSPGKQVLVVAPRWPFQSWLGGPQAVVEPEEVRGAQALATQVLLLWVEIFRFVFIEVAFLLAIGRPDQIPSAEVRAELWRRIEQVYPEKAKAFLDQVETLYKTPGTPLNLPGTSQESLEGREQRGVPLVYKTSIKTPGTPLNRELKGMSRASRLSYKGICFKDKGWWRKVLARLRKSRPELPVFEVQIRTPGGLQRTRGLGDVEAAKAFCKAIGLEVNESAWRVCDARR